MSQSIIGSNAALRYLDAYDAHVNYWREVNPAYQLAFVDNPEHTIYIEQYAHALPNSMIVARIYHPLDGGFHLAPTGPNDTRHYVSSPTEYLSAYGWLGRKKNIILHVMNEPSGFETTDNLMRLVAWMVDYISMAAASETKSVLFNWADRNPKIIDGMMDGMFDNALRLMTAHPELFYMGMHFYGPDEIISHLESYVTRCKFLGIKPPRVIGTEFGLDSTGGTERGYKSRPNYKDIYAQWQETVVKGSLKPYIDSGVLVGLCVFQEGNSGGFEDFDFENDTAYKAEIKRAAQAGEINVPQLIPTPPIVTPPYIPPPFTSGHRYLITTPADFVNVRNSPSTMGIKVGEVPNQSVVTVFEEQLVSGDYWRKVQFGNINGWLSMQGGNVKFAPYIPVDPSTVTIPIDLLKDIQSSLKNDADETRRQSLALAVLSDTINKDYLLVKAILDKIGETI